MTATERFRSWFGEPEPCRGGWRESEVLGNCMKLPAELTWPAQPLNTWSNLAYGVAGLTVFALAPSGVTAVIAVCLLLLTIGSGLYHGWPCKVTNRLDHLGMNLSFSAILGAALGFAAWKLVLFVGLWGVVGVLWRPNVNLSMAVLLGLTWAVSAFPGWPPLMVFSALAFLLAYAVWLLDRWNDGWAVGRYGHALWHVLTAAGLGLLAGGVT